MIDFLKSTIVLLFLNSQGFVFRLLDSLSDLESGFLSGFPILLLGILDSITTAAYISRFMIFLLDSSEGLSPHKRMKFFITDFFSKCDQIRSLLQELMLLYYLTLILSQ